jgi:gluconate 2-dehydrogenase alpha chain
VPPGTPRYGSAWKKAAVKWYQHAASIGMSGSNYANRFNYVDLDPTYKDQLGRPLLRLTYNFIDNDFKVMEYTVGVAAKIARAMNPTRINTPNIRRGDYDIVPYQSTHNTGGTIMGADPKASALNKYLQSWDCHNLFVVGANVFPHNSSYNPTGPVGALAYWTADAIKNRYMKNPGPLVHA